MSTIGTKSASIQYTSKLTIKWRPTGIEATLIQYNLSSGIFGNTGALEVWLFGCGKSQLILQTNLYTGDEALAFILWHKAECLREQTVVDLKKYPLWKGAA